MASSVKVRIFYQGILDAYQFNITTPDVFYRSRTDLATFSMVDYDKPIVSSPVHMVPGVTVAVNVSSEQMIQQWPGSVHLITSYVEKHLYEHYKDIVGLSAEAIYSILKQVQQELLSKEPAAWIYLASDGNGKSHANRDQYKLLEIMPDLSKKFPCPAAADALQCERIQELWGLVQHLNDAHEWKREDIADWLDTLDADLTFKVPDATT